MSLSKNDVCVPLVYEEGTWKISRDPCSWVHLMFLGSKEDAQKFADQLNYGIVLPPDQFCMGTQQADEAREMVQWLWEFYEENADRVAEAIPTPEEFAQFARVRASLVTEKGSVADVVPLLPCPPDNEGEEP